MANIITIPNIDQYEQQIVAGTLILTKKILVILDKALIVQDKKKIYEDAYNNLMIIEGINLSNKQHGRPEHSLEEMSSLIVTQLEKIQQYLPKHNLYERKPFVDYLFDTNMKYYTEFQKVPDGEGMKSPGQYQHHKVPIIHLGNLFKHPPEYYYYTNANDKTGLALPELQHYLPRTIETENYKNFQIGLIEGLYGAIYGVAKKSGQQKHFFTKKHEPLRYHYNGCEPAYFGLEYSYCQQDIAEIIQLAENTLLLIPAFLLK